MLWPKTWRADVRRLVKLVRLRLLQIEIHGYEIAGNHAAIRRAVADEARLRAEVMKP